MTRRTRADIRRDQQDEWLQLHEHALTAACPPPEEYGCGQPAGSPCIARTGLRLIGPPAHHTRLKAADRLAARKESS